MIFVPYEVAKYTVSELSSYLGAMEKNRQPRVINFFWLNGPNGYHGLKQPLYLAQAGRQCIVLLSRWLIMGLRIETGKA